VAAAAPGRRRSSTPRASDDHFAALLARLATEPEVALDTEFHRERSYYPQVALLQLAWSDGEALVDTLAVDPDVLSELAGLLTGPTTFVMHAAGQDLDALDRICGEVPARLFDTQLSAGFVGYRHPSLAALVAGELDVRLPKADRLTDWLRRPLGEAQREYAAADVTYLLELAGRLRAKLAERGRLAWAEDECEELRRRSIVRREPDEAWWRIKEARQLRGKSVRVAQALASWRERVAAETDQPPRFVLPDLALVGIAQRPPESIEELRQVRGLDGRHLRGGQDEEIMRVVANGRLLDAADLRLPPSRSDLGRAQRPAATLSSALISQLARELDIDTTLLATRSDIEEFLLDTPGSRLTRGWRADVVGERLRRLVSGDAAVVLDGDGGLLLEERSHRPVT
jgi:ribonuclease D